MYVIGHSMGAYRAMRTAIEIGRFAAVVPISPCNRVKAAELRPMPVWAFHGSKDPQCPVKVGNELINSLRRDRKRRTEAKQTTYDGAGHLITDRVFETAGLFDWLLRYRAPTGSWNWRAE